MHAVYIEYYSTGTFLRLADPMLRLWSLEPQIPQRRWCAPFVQWWTRLSMISSKCLVMGRHCAEIMLRVLLDILNHGESIPWIRCACGASLLAYASLIECTGHDTYDAMTASVIPRQFERPACSLHSVTCHWNHYGASSHATT